MLLEQNFTIPVPIDEAWRVMLDLPRIAPCMPGAALASFDGESFAGTVKVKLGPIGLTYRGHGRFVARDQAARRVVIEASGADTRAAGTAAATITAQMHDEGGQTRVDVVTDLKITGRPAQFGRGVMADVSQKLLGQFTDCLAGTLTGDGGGTGAAAPAAASPAAEPLASGLAESPATGSVEPPATGLAEPPADSGSAQASAGEAQPSASPSAPTQLTTAATGTPAEVEPIDLLRLARSSSTIRRAVPIAVGAIVVIGLVIWLLVALLS